MRRYLLFLILLLSLLLRIYRLGVNPPSLYWDEASLGYNAYTIATSGRDEHGEFLPLTRFIAFGDYKPPGYIYTAVPSVLLFGLNEFSVRFPSVMAGFLMTIFTYLLVKELFSNEKVAMLASFLFAISPWSLHLSRGAFEANLAALFNLVAIYFFILAQKRKWVIILSSIFFAFSFYTFNSNRIIAPILFFALTVFYIKAIWKNKVWFIISLFLFLSLIAPSLDYLLSREGRLRFQEVTIFTSLEPIKTANERIELDQGNLSAKIIHNRRVLFVTDYLKHYFDNFSGRFLFTHGDRNPRLHVQDMGQLFIFELPFLLLGIYYLVQSKEKAGFLILFWMIIVSIPAATARETPHALRIVSILPTYQIIIAYGLYQFALLIKKNLTRFNIFLFYVLCFMFFVNFYYYLHNYYIHFPVTWSGEWQYGYREMVSYVTRIQDRYDHIFVTKALGRPYIYFAFYQKYPVQKFLDEKVNERDWFGFWEVKALGKIKFDFDKLDQTSGSILLVTTPDNLPGEFQIIKTIKSLQDKDVFLIAEKS